ncbi:hypothetical protein LHYA1_G000990 [Lachnellula hyalina]|uniref:Ubiquitin 3 binding protein But2 C-terminal domain-containing protein n=1 Tax=Lachnellula hyalina TaxID=1316788 RepID=A0A8H8R8C1_9HELO|nr:uncharacterized protein LHYA1_G000990 [Lachnellula hyalina]TVY29556.1 hypothetical protein LHYA1_G000990 [Lachnellula hyalina]
MSQFIFTITTFLALILHASTAVISRETFPCNFFMVAIGGLNGTISQDAVGEPRVGGTFPQASFLIAHGTLTDSLNHTCLISPMTHQLQCTQGLPGSEFKFSDNFLVLHDETNANWLACPAPGPGQDGSYNIYSSQKADSTGCHAIKLQAGSFGCAAQGRPDSSTTGIATSAIASSASKTTNDVFITSASIPASRISTTAATSMPSLSAICPTDISSGIFQFPHLIVPTSPKSPDTAFGNSFKAYISPINSTLFNFDIPTTAPYTGFCSLIFLFPYASELDPSAGTYYFSGIEEEKGENGGLDFARLSGVASASTTYNTTPRIATNGEYGKTQIIPGNGYTIKTFPCQSGTPVTYSVTSVGNVECNHPTPPF